MRYIIRQENFLTAIITTILALLVWFISPYDLLPAWTFVISSVLFLFTLWCLIIQKFDYDKKLSLVPSNVPFEPKIVRVNHQKCELLFTVNIKNILTTNSFFLILSKINGFEYIIARGRVVSINEADLIQATYDMLQDVSELPPQENLIIKPTITSSYLEW